jgi:ADP-ribose pyrophosphatase YjhB (NUDIX family)
VRLVSRAGFHRLTVGHNNVITQRQSIRALLLTPSHELLLLRITPPNGAAPFWIAPGGGLEGEETVEAALRRELREEVDLCEFDLGPLVWRRQHSFDWRGKRICQTEEYFIVRTERIVPHMTDRVEAQIVDRWRWWPISELARSPERLTPLSLADIMARYLRHGPPRGPIELEVVID